MKIRVIVRTLSVLILLSALLLTSLTVHTVSRAWAQAEDEPTEQEQPTEQEVDGYEYSVQPGDNWSSVAARTNITVAELKAANPRAAGRASGWLITGERLFIPVATRMMTLTHLVEYGDSWSTIAKEYGISMQLLKAANPQSLRYDEVLYRGETLFVPVVDDSAPISVPTDAPVAEEADAVEEAPAPAATAVPEEEEPTVESTPIPEEEAGTPVDGDDAAAEAATAEDATDTEETATESSTDTVVPCATDSADYPLSQLLALLANGGDAEGLSAFLTECGSFERGTVANLDLTGDGVDDYVIVYSLTDASSADETVTQPMDLLILNSASEGYRLGHQARAESAVQLLSTLDVNMDGQTDVVWTETTCGAADCFQTVQLYSWDGAAWRSWTDGKVTMANAEIRLEDLVDAGDGLELTVNGGLYTAPDAGPQRERTELWGSVAGAPYTLLSTEFASSNCLYHTVIDGNAAFLNGADDAFTAAETFYTAAISDNTLVACGDHENEIDELRSFGIFRLALISAYQGMPMVVSDLIDSLTLAFPDSLYDQIGQVWLETYEENYAIDEACAAADQFVAAHPEALDILADYGFANPTFTAGDVCPRLDIEIPPLELPTPEPPTATPTSEPTPTPEPTPTAETPVDSAQNDESAAASAAPEAAAGPADEESAASDETMAADDEAATAPEVGEDGLPICPENLAGYGPALPILLDTAAGDPLIVETWLRSCDAMNDERGSFQLADLNGDGYGDAIFLPTVLSDLGFGRDGAQGAVLIYHGNEDGSYALVANPEVYGEPRLLAIDDLNNDRVTDIAWSIEGCSTFCVLEVQIVTWAADTYTSTIASGATITEGEAKFELVSNTDLGNGQQLILTGGVSGTPDGGLAVPHAEVWQSVNRAPFQRIRWTYDRSVDESSCMGLRLVEADVALQASAILGYDAAIEGYTAAIDPTLEACSIYEMDAEEELMVLQGLASFRLIQAQALSGAMTTAQTTLEGFQQGQPESDFAIAAERWLTNYENEGDAAVACEEVLELFKETEALWQITDNYGYNHPALAPEQLCFIPTE